MALSALPLRLSFARNLAKSTPPRYTHVAITKRKVARGAIKAMFYKFNQTSGKVQVAEGVLRAQAAGPTTAEVTHIPAYKPGTGAQGGLARVKTLQAFFKITGHDAPVHLRGTRDQLIYRGIMGFSLLGLSAAFYGLYRMAVGTMPQRER